MWNTGKRKGNRGKHVENYHLWGFLRHLVTSSQVASYIDGTTRKSWGISIVFPRIFLFVKRLEILAHSKMAEVADGCT